ncbi:MAG: sulfur oxidation c-type cytochrome SoxA [Gammaproteobacteria bacterium]|nr:sulfur oxidation c-type cytochrome SoxA [Gammaproteobacteria bacterium]MDH5650891.1 sulfur oxidation c-type cytochrome SoxA [Gammaproteobacteria bacterium]
MKKLIIAAMAIAIAAPLAAVQASPKSDLENMRSLMFKKFPGVKLAEYGNGVYAIDKVRYDEWKSMEDDFPPYEPGLETGEKLFKKYNVGKCFPKGGIGIKQDYPKFNAKSGEVETLEGELMKCLKKNGVDLKAEKLSFKKGKFAAIAAWMAYKSRGNKINVVVPNDPRAMAIYNKGREFFYAKRGQLNFSCADCHVHNPGAMLRTMKLSPVIGQTSHFPAYRKKWQGGGGNPELAGFGTLQRRYGGCNKMVRAQPLKFKGGQHPTYVALEYFHTHLSNGVPINAPGTRQ